MTALQMNAEILRYMSIIAEDESLLKSTAKYLRKLAAEKENATRFTKEEFLRMLDEAEKGPSMRFESIDKLDEYINL